MVEKSVLLEKVCGKIYIREVYKSEFGEVNHHVFREKEEERFS